MERRHISPEKMSCRRSISFILFFLSPVGERRVFPGFSAGNDITCHSCSDAYGESKPVAKQVGEKVIGGSINGEGSITVAVRKTGKESFLSQVIELVRQAQKSKSKTQDLAWATGYNIVAIPLAAGVLYKFGILLTPAAGAVLMASSTVIVAINARFLKIIK